MNIIQITGRSVRLLLLAAALSAPTAGVFCGELRARALKGDAQAQLELAGEFFFGKNRPANHTLAAYWYRRAAQNGSTGGEYNLGCCYEHGWGVEKSLQKAFQYYSLAAKKDFPPALTRRALLYLTGVPAEDLGEEKFEAIPADKDLAFAELRRAAAMNYAPAKLALAARLFRDPKFRETHASEIADLARDAANDPHAEVPALMLYADCLLNGFGTDPDVPRAVKLLERAAAMNSGAALTGLGRLFEFGRGVPPDPARAMEFYRRAAELGAPEGETAFADQLLAGNHLNADPVRAYTLYRKATERGYAPAFAKLGDCLAFGWGVERDLPAAFAAYEAGAKLGDAAAQFRLGGCYAEGRGVKRDPAAAVFWYKCAGAAGNRDAIRELGIAFLHGKGVDRNPAEGRRLLDAAARAGDREAAKILEEL